MTHGWSVHTPKRTDLDLLSRTQVEAYLSSTRASVLINTVAYTKVDQAEDEPEEADRLNRQLPFVLSQACQALDLYLVHYSTDFVFNGKKHTPYTPDDLTDPLSVYGRTKLQGERELQNMGLDRLLIIRTAWLFGPHKTNFVSRILELAATRPELGIVHDQVGSPTYTLDLAAHTLALMERQATGIFHLVNAGQASWCELAAEAVQCTDIHSQIRPITSAQYPQKAARPAFSVLDTSKFRSVTGMSPRPGSRPCANFS